MQRTQILDTNMTEQVPFHILEQFRAREKLVSKSSQNSNRFLIRFFIDFGFILDPIGHSKTKYLLYLFDLGVALVRAILAPRGPPKRSKTARCRVDARGSGGLAPQQIIVI